VSRIFYFGSAASSLIRLGDYLLTVDGVDVSPLSLMEVRAVLRSRARLFQEVVFTFGE
jgi:hypothetical protein